MKNPYLILVADRNPRIRDFIQRELKYDGHRVFTVENYDQMKNWITRPGPLDILVIDPNMSGLDDHAELESILLGRPTLSVIFHCMASDYLDLSAGERKVLFVEKSGQSVDLLKQRIGMLFDTALTQ